MKARLRCAAATDAACCICCLCVGSVKAVAERSEGDSRKSGSILVRKLTATGHYSPSYILGYKEDGEPRWEATNFG